MKKRVLAFLALVLLCCVTAMAQQAPMQPLTFWYDYTVNPGKEDQFLELVKTVGAPVRDKFMAEGVVLAWGVQTPLLRVPGNATHSIWYAVADWSGVEKVQSAMQAQIARLSDEAANSGATKKNAAGAQTPTARIMDVADVSKTHDYLTRDLVFNVTHTAPPEGFLPYTRFNFFKVKPGKAAEFRKTWEKYNKPVLDKLLADGVIVAYGLAVEEVRTDGDFTHFTWYDVKDLASMDKIRAAFLSDREHRSQEEQDAISALFTSEIDLDASRSDVEHAVLFHVAPMK
jgi:hypothetical protein